MASEEFDVICKVVLMGEMGVGKTSLVAVAGGLECPTEHQATVGMDFLMRIMEIGDKKVKLQMWDASGDKRFRQVCTSYFFRGTHGFFIVYDVTDRKSYETVSYWASRLEKEGNGSPCMLLANKADRTDRVVTKEEGEKRAEELGILYAETSAKDGSGVEAAFRKLATGALEKAMAAKEEAAAVAGEEEEGEDDDEADVPLAATGCLQLGCSVM